MLDDPGQLKKLVDGGATFMDVLSYLTSAVGPQDAQATTETVQVGRLAQSFGTSLRMRCRRGCAEIPYRDDLVGQV